jgi:hypothetical protein
MKGRYLYKVPTRGSDRGPGISWNGLEGSPLLRYLATDRNKVWGVALIVSVFRAHLFDITIKYVLENKSLDYGRSQLQFIETIFSRHFVRNTYKFIAMLLH